MCKGHCLDSFHLKRCLPNWCYIAVHVLFTSVIFTNCGENLRVNGLYCDCINLAHSVNCKTWQLKRLVCLSTLETFM